MTRRVVGSSLVAALGLLGATRPGPGRTLRVEGLPKPEDPVDMQLRLERIDKAAKRRARRNKKRLR